MSEYLGVITWNVRGDLSTSGTAAQRAQDLNEALTELANQGQPVDFICLQETSGDHGKLKEELEKAGYTCYALREGDGEGDYYVFAASPASGFTFDSSPEQCLFTYESPSGSPLRYPAVAKLTREDGLKVAVYTYHASLDGGLLEGLMRCSRFAADAAESENFDYVLVAGDLNVTTDHTFFDSKLGKYVNTLNRLFQGFAGVSENLDHAFCRPDLGFRNIRGCHFSTSSDHALLYGRFEIG